MDTCRRAGRTAPWGCQRWDRGPSRRTCQRALSQCRWKIRWQVESPRPPQDDPPRRRAELGEKGDYHNCRIPTRGQLWVVFHSSELPTPFKMLCLQFIFYSERRKDWQRILTVVDRPVDIGVGGHPHKGEVSEVDLRKRQDQGMVVVLQVLARVGHQHSQVVGIFVRIRIVCSEHHRAPELPILSAIFWELDDERRSIGTLHHLGKERIVQDRNLAPPSHLARGDTVGRGRWRRTSRTIPAGRPWWRWCCALLRIGGTLYCFKAHHHWENWTSPTLT